MPSSPSQQKKNESPTADQAAMELMQPGPEHAALAKTVGTWQVACTHWMKEGAEPSKSTGKSSFTKLFDGRFIREEFTGDFQGKPFTGIGTMGFDRAAKQFVHTWCDSMGTGITMTRGAPGSDGKELVLRGTMTCPIRGEVRLRHVCTRSSDDAFTITMYGEKDGKESKNMELLYTRQA